MADRLFHISDRPDIRVFEPRPSPSHFDEIKGDVVFAISGKLLHNYLLPRDCPRVTFYAGPGTSDEDRSTFLSHTSADCVVVVESGWYQQIAGATLYCYEFSTDSFMLLDEIAGYYISYRPAIPVEEVIISDLIEELSKRNVELRFTPSLTALGDAVKESSLHFSLIRMRNASKL